VEVEVDFKCLLGAMVMVEGVAKQTKKLKKVTTPSKHKCTSKLPAKDFNPLKNH